MDMPQNQDFKYVLQDFGNIYIGARYSYEEMLKSEEIPYKWKAIIRHYLLKETSPETTMENHIFFMKEDDFAYETDDMKAYLKENPNFETAINQLKDSPVNANTAGVLSGVQTEARLTFNEIMPQVYDGKLTTQDAVDQLAASVNKAIENYNESIK